VEFHLRDAELFPHRSHYISKRPLHARTRLNLFATLGHLGEHRDLLSATGQLVVTDNCGDERSEERV
jgi:hypothetical protein